VDTLIPFACELARKGELTLAAEIVRPHNAARFAQEARASGVMYTTCLLVLYLVEGRTMTDLAHIREKMT